MQNDFAGIDNCLLRDFTRHTSKGDVNSQRHNAQTAAHQHHDRAIRARQLREIFRMSREFETALHQ